METLKSPSHWLAAELGNRRSTNSRYSLRSLSKTGGISPGRLSELIAGKRARRELPIKPDYVGQTIEDRYMVGYGMDSEEVGRNYGAIYYFKQ